MCHPHVVLMLTTVQLSALMLNHTCAGNPKRIVAKTASIFCPVSGFWRCPEVPASGPELPLRTSGNTSGSTSAYGISVLYPGGSGTGSWTGSTGLRAGTSAFKVPSELPAALPLMKIRYWFLPEPGPELGPEVLLVPVLPGLRAEVPPWQD